MKKLFLASAFALFGVMNAQSAGNFKLGAHIGLPTGDSSTFYNFYAGADVAYMFPVSSTINLGVTSGYSFFTGKTIGSIKVGTLSLIPIAGTVEYKFSPMFSLGVDLGYGILFASGGNSDGGFYYQPKAAYHFGPSEVNLGYMGVSKNGSTLGAVTLGYAYSFGK